MVRVRIQSTERFIRAAARLLSGIIVVVVVVVMALAIPNRNLVGSLLKPRTHYSDETV